MCQKCLLVHVVYGGSWFDSFARSIRQMAPLSFIGRGEKESRFLLQIYIGMT